MFFVFTIRLQLIYKIMQNYVSIGCIMVSERTNGDTPKMKGKRKMFELGKTYTTRCYGDHDLTEAWTITKKTAKTITAKSDIGEVKTVKIRTIDGRECAKMADGFGYIRA